MRFVEKGPAIPGGLLNARDEGRVVFFCGAGVSRARAGLPHFFGLAEAVLKELGVSEDSDARKVLNKAWEIGDELNVTGLISADRVFGLLEREFAVRDIQAAVAKSLSLSAKPNVSAHEMLLRLATTPASKVQLVTTNFDRLFEECDQELPIFEPPRLPNPSRYDDLDGIVYLHGRVNDAYTGASGSGFVLSSSDFGYAYLSEGWATEFFREIVRGYNVAFIGYSADDPPIHYLLEGLRRTRDSAFSIYAFQANESDESVARWRHKGVEAIPYSEADDHRALWDTLELWAQRADNPVLWRQNVLDRAMRGPGDLTPHERGQVAHIVSTYEGVREFQRRTPPAEWLCVFDPACRYASPEHSSWFDDEDPVDPFTLYSLDWDAIPERGDPDNQFVTRHVPSDAWDAFVANDLDRQESVDENFAALRGHYAGNFPRLFRRIECLGAWIASVADQPAALWWFAKQDQLHPGVRKGVEWGLERLFERVDPAVLEAWRYLLETRERSDDDARQDWYGMKQEIDRDGWGAAATRKFIALTRPYLKAGPAIMSKPTPPETVDGLRVSDLLRIEVECPVLPHDADIPNEWLEHVIQGLRKNIEAAVQLCEEVGDQQISHIVSLSPEPSSESSDYDLSHGLSGYVVRFATLFEQLLQLDARKAEQEFAAWPIDDDTAFSRLRIWAGGKSELIAPERFCQIIRELSNDAFWSDDHQRDLLLVLACRWNDLPEGPRKEIEERLLEGPPKWEGEDEEIHAKHKGWVTLDRLKWLADSGCEFSFDVEREIATRRTKIPTWKPASAKHAADLGGTRAGFVTTNTEYASLLSTPIDDILQRARELAGRTAGPFEELDPFAGLCEDRPRRAYLALIHAARNNVFPESEWETFLTSQRWKEDKTPSPSAIAERSCRFPDEAVSRLLSPLTWWLQQVGHLLSKDFPQSFDRLIARLIGILHLTPHQARSAIVARGSERDWVTEAINSPVGRIARVILEDSQVATSGDRESLPVDWLRRAESLLAMTGDPRCHAIAMLSHHLGWFYWHASEWTEHNLLSILDGDEEDEREALWAGFLWNAKVTSVDFYSRLKCALLAFVQAETPSRVSHVRTSAYLVLWGWIAPPKMGENRQISNDEFREVLLQCGDEFRSHIVWQLERGLKDADEGNRRDWIACCQEFFRDVWPRQSVVKTPTTTGRLCGLLFASEEGLLALSDVVLPLLNRVDRGVSLRFHFREEVRGIIDRQPLHVLQILYAVLPEEVSAWPYGIGDAIERIGAADSTLPSDSRLLDLRRKWNAR